MTMKPADALAQISLSTTEFSTWNTHPESSTYSDKTKTLVINILSAQAVTTKTPSHQQAKETQVANPDGSRTQRRRPDRSTHIRSKNGISMLIKAFGALSTLPHAPHSSKSLIFQEHSPQAARQSSDKGPATAMEMRLKGGIRDEMTI